MSELHPSRDELAWYVTDGLAVALRGWPSDRVRQVEDHVAGCATCAAQLAGEAQLEVALGEVADAEARRADTTSVLAWLGGAAAVAVVAVAIAFGGGGDAAPHETTTPAMTAPVDAGPVELALDSAPDSPAR